MIKKAVIISFSILFPQLANADEASRNKLIFDIIQAQHIEQSFQQAIDQSRELGKQVANDIAAKLIQGKEDVSPGDRDKLEAILQKHMERCSTMWKPEELTNIWAKNYGAGLSEKELKQILAYYQSPIGQRDVASMQKTMQLYTNTVSTEGRNKLETVTNQLIEELNQLLSSSAQYK